MTMRVLHVVPTYLPATRYGGPIYSVHGLCKGLVRQGVDVSVLTTNVDGSGDSDVPIQTRVDMDGVGVWYYPSNYLRRLYFSTSMMKDLPERLGEIDLLHVHSIFLWPTTAAARLARARGVPYVVSPRGMLVRELVERKRKYIKKAWIRLFERANLEGAAAIHVTSQSEADAAAQFRFRLPPLLDIANGLDPPTSAVGSAASAEFTERGPYLAYLGRVSWKKGLDRLIQALQQVPDIRLLIAGNDDENLVPKLRSQAQTLGLLERVEFLGHVSGDKKRALLKNAVMFVLPSQHENFGNVVLEAMAEACPVVVTQSVGAAEVVLKANAGLVVKGDADSLAEAIRRLEADPARRADMGQRGASIVTEEYGWDTVASKMLKAYQEILG